MKQNTGFYPALSPRVRPSHCVGQAGGTLLVETVRAVGLDHALREQLTAWRKPLACHDPGKVVLDLALTLALGGDCLADINLVRSEAAAFGRVASDPTVSRIITAPARDAHGAGRVSRWPCCCAPATPAAIRPAITFRSSSPPWPNCPDTHPCGGETRVSLSAPTGRVPPTTSPRG